MRTITSREGSPNSRATSGLQGSAIASPDDSGRFVGNSSITGLGKSCPSSRLDVREDAKLSALDVCRLWHSRLQLDHLAIHSEPAVSVMVDGLRILLRRIDPGLEHFQDEEIVLVDETGIGHLAFEIGETFGHQRRRHALGWRRCQTESLELLHVPARAVADS